ncbi:MAG: PLP-dependent transferase [Puniceicoccaceae bacterium]
MKPTFQPYPLGHSINGSPHSVCVSLPTMADVIGYEEKDPRVLEAFTAGYPRFFRNPLIAELASHLSREGIMNEEDPLLPTQSAAVDLCHYLDLNPECAAPVLSLWTVRLPEGQDIRLAARAFLQHTGCGISSREAETLLEQHFGHAPHPEDRAPGHPEEHLAYIRSRLHSIYGTLVESDIHIFRSGMNAFYSGFRAIQAVQLERKRDLWIQLGWLYVDTSRILEKFSLQGAAPVQIYNVMDLSELEDVLHREGHRVAGIVTEVPTNPLVQTPDVEALRELADKYRAALILDPTLVSPHNVNILSYSDLHINSLTKYAASSADVMMGAIALNGQSRFYDDLREKVAAFGTAPASGDLARMALQIQNYPETIKAINATTVEVAAFLEKHPGVKQLYWARSQPSAYNYNWLQHLESGPGGILTFTTHKPLREFYDRCNFVKSPSFGTRFTMMCPFMYLAHYDLVSTPQGRDILLGHGVDPDLIRLSIGLEPAGAIISELERTL